MAIGPYRADPEAMAEAERAVAAAQYPEGGLVAGMGIGMVVALLTTTALLVVTPFAGGLLGYAAGARVRDRKVEQRR